jgi:hypothetical protein
MSVAIKTVTDINALQASPFRPNGVRRRGTTHTYVNPTNVPVAGYSSNQRGAASSAQKLAFTMTASVDGIKSGQTTKRFGVNGQLRPNDYDDSKVILDEDVVAMCERFNMLHPKAQECRRILKAEVKKGDVLFYRGGKEFRPPQRFLERFQSEWIGVFAMDFVDSLLTRGIVPVSYRSDRNDPRVKIPFVMRGDGFVERIFNEELADYEFRYYRIPQTMLSDTFTSQTLGSVKRNGSGPGAHDMAIDAIFDSDVIVFAHLGYDPGRNGEIQSPVASLLKDIFITDKYEELTLGQIERSQINWIVTESAQQVPGGYGGGAQAAELGVQFDPLWAEQEELERRVQQDRMNMKRTEEQRRFYRDYFQRDEDLQKMNPFMGFSDVSRVVAPPRFLPVPSGFKFSHRLEDHSVALDLDKQRELLSDRIHGVYGVPKSFSEGQSTKTSSAAENAAQIMQTVVEEYQSVISRVISDIVGTLDGMYGIMDEDDDDDEEKKTKGEESLTRQTGSFFARGLAINAASVRTVPGRPPVGTEPNDDVSPVKQSEKEEETKKKKKGKITVVFSAKPKEPFEVLTQKFAAGIITADEYTGLERNRSGLSSKQQDGETAHKLDAWNKDDRRMLFTGQKKEAPKASGGGVSKKKKKTTKKKTAAAKSPKSRPKPKAKK